MASKQILIVDDDEQMQYLLSELLRHRGFRVICRSDIPSALVELRNTRPDLVLLDLCMSGSDGTCFLKNAAHYCPEGFSKPPIIVLSVFRDKEIVDYALENGATDYMTKPFDPNKLLRRVEDVLSAN